MTCKSLTLPVYEMTMDTQTSLETPKQTFSFQYMTLQCEVGEVKKGRAEIGEDRRAGFRVSISFYPGMDEMWESLTHEALFEDKRDAEKLADRIKKARAIHLEHWVWCPSKCTPFARLQEAPTAKLSKVAIPSRHRA